MELLLLGAGAIVLIGITLWIVWPARTADTVGASLRGEEVSETTMTETVRSVLAPQGDRFEDQYTSATADLSAGGVAAAVEAMQEHPEATPQPAPVVQSYGTPVRPTVTAAPYPVPEPMALAAPRGLGLGAGALLALGGGVGGAWLYARWQRERNKPINRLRRSAREMASRLGERIPDVEELPHGTAPMSGAATALLLTALIASRAMHRDSGATDQLEAVAQDAVKRGHKVVERGRKESTRLSASSEARRPAIMGVGLGGMALIAGGAYAVWRLLRGRQPERSTWYTGE